MAYGPDGTPNMRSREQRRIDWGARRREVSRILRDPPTRIWWGMDLDQLLDELGQALYLAEAQAEHVPDPSLLSACLLAKGAAFELYRRLSIEPA
jgi:hypothetical protein